MKARIFAILIRFVMGAIALGVGIWYMSSSIGGASLAYTSMDNFMTAVGASDGNVANVNGCFLCDAVAELFGVLGRAAELFWGKIIGHIWILMAIGFGIFLFVHTAQYIWDATKTTAKLDTSAKKFELTPWFDKVWKLGVRIMLVGAALGMISMGGTTALRTVSDIIITPVLFIGAHLSMIASGVSDAATCGALATGASGGILSPIFEPFMCVIGNINSIMLAGAAGGFSLMNYAWMGLGGGVMTWIAGIGLVIMFLLIGFDLFFQILSVIFKLIFLVIFMPLLVAAYAFEGTWDLAKGVVGKAITMLVQSAIKIVVITLKVLITYAMIYYAAETVMPGAAIMPPLMGHKINTDDEKTLSVQAVFSTCERVSLTDGVMDADKFKPCFMEQRSIVEQRYPGAFDFMDNGWDFLVLMGGLFFVYFYVIQVKVEGLLGKDSKESFDFGGQILQLGKDAWNKPSEVTEKIKNKLDAKA